MVGIKNMEMPETCSQCKLSVYECCGDYYFCPFSGEDTEYAKRRDDCPLVEIDEVNHEDQ